MYWKLLCCVGFIVTYGYVNKPVATNHSTCTDKLRKGRQIFETVTISNVSTYGTDACTLRNDKIQIVEVVPADKTKFTFRDIYVCIPRTIKRGTLTFNGVILESKPKVSVLSLCESRDSMVIKQTTHQSTTFLLLRMYPVSELNVIYIPAIYRRGRTDTVPRNISRHNERVHTRLKKSVLSQVNYTSKANIIDSSECGSTKGCFRDGDSSCQHFECNYFFSFWTDNTIAYIELSGKSDGWVAIGFSSDGTMGGDDIIYACIYDNRRRNIQATSYKTEHAHIRPELINNLARLRHSENKNGYMYCRFEVPVTRDDTLVDLTNEWTQLYARGGIIDGMMEKHASQPIVSKMKISLIEHPNVVSCSSAIVSFPVLIITLGLLL